MSSYRVLRRDDHLEMPWLNGGGSTLQVMTSPDGAGMGDFAWRVSFARVEGSGPFSRFEGVDRVITLVEGEGLRLTVDDGSGPRVVELEPHEPFAFAGEDDVSCEVAGPSLDLNLMTRRDRCTGAVRTEQVGAGQIGAGQVSAGQVRTEQVTERVGAEPLRVEAREGEDVLVAVLAGEVVVEAGTQGPDPLSVLDVVVDLGAPLTLTGDGTVAVLRVAPDGILG